MEDELILTFLLVATSFGINNQKANADSDYSVEIVYGYDRSYGAKWLTGIFALNSGGIIQDNGNSLYDERNETYVNTTY